MWDDDLLTLEQATLLTGRAKRTLRELARTGQLPAVRREGQWLFARADLRSIERGPRAGPAASGQAAPILPAREEMMALLELLRQRDAQIETLQDERMRLAGQVGFLQGQLLEREERMRLLQATSIYQRDVSAGARTGDHAMSLEEHTPTGHTRDGMPAGETTDRKPTDRSGAGDAAAVSDMGPTADGSPAGLTQASTIAVNPPDAAPVPLEPTGSTNLETAHVALNTAAVDAIASNGDVAGAGSEAHLDGHVTSSAVPAPEALLPAPIVGTADRQHGRTRAATMLWRLFGLRR